MIDVEQYRERRREYLTTLAHRIADKVRQTQRVVTLNPMSPRTISFWATTSHREVIRAVN